MKKIMPQVLDITICEKLLNSVITSIFVNGAVDTTLLEVLTVIKMFQPTLFGKYESQVLIKMGLFYKPIEPTSFDGLIFRIYQEYIHENFNGDFTPVQANIIENIEDNRVFSFSSPTSTGKSYIFRYLLNHFENDIVIIVPSRALINEYYKKVSEIIRDKETNIMTFVDIVNTKHARRSIFIITPERTKDLFQQRNRLSVDILLFDEAQLSDEDSIRGMFYDSVVRRAMMYFPNSRVCFAYPFISNPNAQFIKNNIEIEQKKAVYYNFKNVGQVFYSYDDNRNFYIFGTEISFTGPKYAIDYDPLSQVLQNGGTALIYCAKSSIYDKKIFTKFRRYFKFCPKITDRVALDIINQIREYIGASEVDKGDYASLMIRLMKKGIVEHHGSLPLKVRILIEEFTQKGFCRICFATATLEQGINMPFDLVWIEKFEPSKQLDVKNLIGRAGRSTNKPIFDYGQIVIKDSSRKQLSDIIHYEYELDTVSQLDNLVDPEDDYLEYKQAIRNGTFSEEYNLTESELQRIESTSGGNITLVLSSLFIEDQVDFSKLGFDEEERTLVINAFIDIYQDYLHRNLTSGEESVLTTAIKILFWRVRGKMFNQIVGFRYAYAAQVNARKDLLKLISTSDSLARNTAVMRAVNNLDSHWLTMYQMIPNRKIIPLNINYDKATSTPIKAFEVDFDRVVVDTYDYIDKLLGFRLGDVFYAAFDKFSKNANHPDILRNQATKMTNYIKYGTDNPIEIWLLRYGYDFDEMEWLIPIVRNVSEEEIEFLDTSSLSESQKNRISKHLFP